MLSPKRKMWCPCQLSRLDFPEIRLRTTSWTNSVSSLYLLPRSIRRQMVARYEDKEVRCSLIDSLILLPPKTTVRPTYFALSCKTDWTFLRWLKRHLLHSRISWQAHHLLTSRQRSLRSPGKILELLSQRRLAPIKWSTIDVFLTKARKICQLTMAQVQVLILLNKSRNPRISSANQLRKPQPQTSLKAPQTLLRTPLQVSTLKRNLESTIHCCWTISWSKRRKNRPDRRYTEHFWISNRLIMEFKILEWSLREVGTKFWTSSQALRPCSKCISKSTHHLWLLSLHLCQQPNRSPWQTQTETSTVRLIQLSRPLCNTKRPPSQSLKSQPKSLTARTTSLLKLTSNLQTS